ncbi:hypothetical protein N7499_002885 [Penicillium canescens]|uniref:Uncharacterized protein n=1 Tax=Penicillium canescens TaxID=5083 RepID=A0AAD6HYE5_PENCN|nr:uncharacterized protein N7446_014151 [Penicillium canescens]XP_058375336.1 uncharacterized protein N7446_005259 [Penicillium canescens]KAJ6022351.1 hypothetical protein N7460_014095 [Penicillium canescens]KAJ6038456.1 hypothetical protein N7460_008227 [Penicillium canescens]KAJ6038999.1 hypothetical protein N7446_014151 [Penicillium canescens]KAJ6066238.1 hypothetical protein N7444_000230 [Penicillium canescens]KAJ6068222.1 hypothetical protein N7446_005259 [Penicillium canescens]
MSSTQILRSGRQPGGYEARFSSLLCREEQQKPTSMTSRLMQEQRRLKETPDLTALPKDEKGSFAVDPANPRVSSYHAGGWLYCADLAIGSLHERVNITQDGFADVLTENRTLLRETTALKERIQELEETVENMKARLDGLCKSRQVSTFQENRARKKRAMLNGAHYSEK